MANHQYKDSVFRMLFNNPAELAKLFQAMREIDDISPDDLTITTLNNVLFDSVKNDLSFEWKDQAVVLMEHQSTWNENIPARMLAYAGRLMEKARPRKRAVYRSKLDKLPAPHFYMLYFGKRPPKKYELRLSDAYREPSNDLELICHVLDITYGRMAEFLKGCLPLAGYSYFIHTVEEQQAELMDLDEAIREAILD